MGAVLPTVDNSAHIGGLLGGAASGWLLVRPFEPAARAVARPWQVAGVIGVVCAALAVLVALGAVTRGNLRLMVLGRNQTQAGETKCHITRLAIGIALIFSVGRCRLPIRPRVRQRHAGETPRKRRRHRHACPAQAADRRRSQVHDAERVPRCNQRARRGQGRHHRGRASAELPPMQSELPHARGSRRAYYSLFRHPTVGVAAAPAGSSRPRPPGPPDVVPPSEFRWGPDGQRPLIAVSASVRVDRVAQFLRGLARGAREIVTGTGVENGAR